MIAPRVDLRPTAGGFTLLEVVVAIVILAVGVIGMAATAALVVRQVTVSRVTTERTAARQTAIERVRAVGYDSLDGSSRDTLGNFTVAWTVADAGNSKLVRFVMTGPGLRRSEGALATLGPAVSDTFTYRMIRP